MTETMICAESANHQLPSSRVPPFSTMNAPMNGFHPQTDESPAGSAGFSASVECLDRVAETWNNSPTALPAVGVEGRTIHLVTGNYLLGELLAVQLGAVLRPEVDAQGWIDSALPPDLVLVDGSFDPTDPTVGRALKRCRVHRLAIVVFGCSRDPLAAARWVDLGVDALCFVDESLAVLSQLVVRISRGETVLGVSVRETLLSELRRKRATERERQSHFESLTKREMEVLRLLAQATTPEEIARISFVSLNTVRTQIRSILAKLATSSVVGAVAHAYSSGWMESVPTTKVEWTIRAPKP